MKLLHVLNPVAYLPSVASLYRLLAARRLLLWEMGKRDIRDRYVGQTLGVYWAVLTPLLTMAVYLFIFAFVFRIRMPASTMDGMAQGWGGSYALYLLSGLIPWMGFQEVMNRATAAVTGNANLVKQVIFPLEILPLKILLSAFLAQGVALAIFLAYGLLRFGPPSPMILLLPWLFLVQLLASAGIALLLAAVAPFFRDIKDLVGLFCFVLIYAMPIFFTQDMLPSGMYRLLMLNPFSHMIECYHDALYWGAFMSPWSWLIFPVVSVALFALGCRTFTVLKMYFGNVL
jgi:lipopolysaccharide transport system permease protein